MRLANQRSFARRPYAKLKVPEFIFPVAEILRDTYFLTHFAHALRQDNWEGFISALGGMMFETIPRLHKCLLLIGPSDRV
jgi:hypothetical protein